jgi:hypothetical protein
VNGQRCWCLGNGLQGYRNSVSYICLHREILLLADMRLISVSVFFGGGEKKIQSAGFLNFKRSEILKFKDLDFSVRKI